MSDLKKYLGMVGHYPDFGKATIVAVKCMPDRMLLRLDSHPERGWPETVAEMLVRFRSINDVIEHLPLDVIFKCKDEELGFWWINVSTAESKEFLATLQSPVKKIYVKDLEELAELEQAKKAQESAKRSASNQWRHQRHEAARAIFGVRKGRW